MDFFKAKTSFPSVILLSSVAADFIPARLLLLSSSPPSGLILPNVFGDDHLIDLTGSSLLSTDCLGFGFGCVAVGGDSALGQVPLVYSQLPNKISVFLLGVGIK